VKPHPDEIRNYYDEKLSDKIRDYVQGNDRVERAWETVVEWAPPNPRRVLEVGCGVGHVTARLGRRWPRAEIVAVDISGESIRLARLLFSRPQTIFVEGSLDQSRVEGFFDLVVLMDVYEHIAAEERKEFHDSLRLRLGSDCRIIMTCPTPRVLEWSRVVHPNAIQPIDENIDLIALQSLAADLHSRVVHYQEIDVWHFGDYFHVVLEPLRDFGEAVRRKSALRLPWRVGSQAMQRVERATRRARVNHALRKARLAPSAR